MTYYKTQLVIVEKMSNASVGTDVVVRGTNRYVMRQQWTVMKAFDCIA